MSVFKNSRREIIDGKNEKHFKRTFGISLQYMENEPAGVFKPNVDKIPGDKSLLDENENIFFWFIYLFSIY